MVTLTKIYTKTGDKGTTGVVSEERLSKTHPRIEAIGTVDELNASIGLARTEIPEDHAISHILAQVQNDLFDLGADLATPDEMEGALRLAGNLVETLEQAIDALNADMLPLTSFILPAGGKASASLHMARAIARRAERRVWTLSGLEKGNNVSQPVPVYLNRLSDYLFVAARSIALETETEVLWVPGGT